MKIDRALQTRSSRAIWMLEEAVVEPAMAEKFSTVEPNRVRNGWSDFD